MQLFCKSKKQHYANLNEKDVADNKKFISRRWANHYPDIKVAEELNSFFSNVVKNLKIPEYNETNPLVEGIANPILKSVLKYDKNPSVNAIGNLNIRSHFEHSFEFSFASF